MALIGHYDKKDKPKKSKEKKQENKDKPVKPDTWIEKTHFRPLAAEDATDRIFKIFDIYKKSHSMESYT